ncbi:Tc5 transposase DNA-binding domain-containing protein [Metschnikowia aff. pulcherrima]|uniref:Tc5 transposase DNA-binding domain-containing protein n=1 Tax=Metschnikowia aff. pulcherrima TaxID=2163413 RepID=A0A4P6XVM5_9ASCO|nr:Tc5 transposase DNA-binding domain-containing protein [Metschnikowia aff. pulcherrima]
MTSRSRLCGRLQKSGTRNSLNRRQGRQSVLIEHKLLLKRYGEENPGHLLSFYSDWFRNKFGYVPHKSTISRSLDLSGKKQMDKEREQAERLGGNFKRKLKFRQAEHPEFEMELLEYLLKHERNVPYTGPMIQEIALKLWRSKDRGTTKEFKGSNGWLRGFLNRHDLRSVTRHGEAESVNEEAESMNEEAESINEEAESINEEDHEKFREELKEVISKYAPEDIWNCDETSLLWKKLPNRGYSSKGYSGKKGGTYSRITAMFCCNADGSDKFRPWFIGKQDHYECFGGNNKMLDSLDCHYSGREKALMDADLMEHWLISFNEYVKRKGRKALLLMNDHSSHKTAVRVLAAAGKLDCAKVHFLPPNTTSKLQPLDQGIIRKFKSGYAIRWLRFLLRCSLNSVDPVKRVTMLDAIKWSICAWAEVDADCIYHCWRHTRYFEIPLDDPVEVVDEALLGSLELTGLSGMIDIVSLREDLETVDALLSELRRRGVINDRLTGGEFLDLIDEVPPMQSEFLDTRESRTSESEIKDTLDIGNETQQETGEKESCSAMSDGSQDNAALKPGLHNRYVPISEHKDVVKKIDWLMEYLEEHEIDRKDLKYRLFLKKLRSEITKPQQQRSRQPKITQWARA